MALCAAGLAHVPAAHYLIFDGAPKQAAIGAKIRDLSAGLAAGGARAGGPVAAGGGSAEALAEPLSEAECASGARWTACSSSGRQTCGPGSVRLLSNKSHVWAPRAFLPSSGRDSSYYSASRVEMWHYRVILPYIMTPPHFCPVTGRWQQRAAAQAAARWAWLSWRCWPRYCAGRRPHSSPRWTWRACWRWDAAAAAQLAVDAGPIEASGAG